MERRRHERRLLQSPRLTTTLLLQISICTAAFVLIISLVLFWINYQNTKTRLIEQVSLSTEHRVNRQSDFFQRVEANSVLLGNEFVQRYQRLGNVLVN